MKMKNIIFFVLLLGFISLGVFGTFSIVNNQTLSLLGSPVYVGEFFSTECSKRTENMNLVNVEEHTDEGTFYHCTTEGAAEINEGRWIPQVPGIQCEFIINDFSAATVHRCTGVINDKSLLDDESVCTSDLAKFWTVSLGDSQSFTIKAGQTAYIDTDKVFGSARLDVRLPSYGLRAETAQGLKFPQTKTCELESLNVDYKVKGVVSNIVQPGVPFNIATDYALKQTSQAVRLENINSGEPIWITQPGYYIPLEKKEDGWYADLSIPPIYDNRIKCIPRSTGCSDEAVPVSLEEQSCDSTSGAVLTYSPVEGDSEVLCKYLCIDGKLQVSDDCINVPSECPEGEIWNEYTGECDSVETSEEIQCELTGGSWTAKKTRKCDFLCEIGLGEEIIIEEEYCRQPIDFTSFILVGVGIIGALLVFGIGKKTGAVPERRK